MVIKDENARSIAAPVSQSERITLLDSLRGVGLLGILLMNMPGFAFPELQTDNPFIFNETGINYTIWYYVELVFAGTQRALFSMLFGAGLILFITRQQNRTEGLMPAEYLFRRQLWLLLFGLFNAFVLMWFWDILFDYALYGMMLFPFYRMKAKSLIIAAAVCLVLMTTRENVNLYRTKELISKGERIALLDTISVKLTDKEKGYAEAAKELREKATIAAKQKEAKKETEAYLGTYPEIYKAASEKSVHSEMYYTYYLLWDVLIFIFLGMAWYKTGIITGNATTKFYWILFLGGMIPGILLNYMLVQSWIQTGFNEYEHSKNAVFSYHQIARVLRSIGFFGFLMVLYKSNIFNWFFALMRPVGQMAFTNYLMQSFLCGLYFYGVGLGYFGQLERYQIYIVVAVVWAIQIIWSHVWLKYFLFGPIEWVWRSLTYWKKQPMRRMEVLIKAD